MAKPKKDESSQMTAGDITFAINGYNERMLKVYAKYIQFVETKAETKESGCLMDGVINELLYISLIKKLTEITKRHGFENVESLIQAIEPSKSVDETSTQIIFAEQNYYEKLSKNVYSHIPLPDNQKKFGFAE